MTQVELEEVLAEIENYRDSFDNQADPAERAIYKSVDSVLKFLSIAFSIPRLNSILHSKNECVCGFITNSEITRLHSDFFIPKKYMTDAADDPITLTLSFIDSASSLN